MQSGRMAAADRREPMHGAEPVEGRGPGVDVERGVLGHDVFVAERAAV